MILTPNLVHFKADFSINWAVLREYTSWLIGRGVTGLHPNGSPGEFIRVSFEQRTRVVQIMADKARGWVPVQATPLPWGLAPRGMEESAVSRLLEDLAHHSNHITAHRLRIAPREAIRREGGGDPVDRRVRRRPGVASYVQNLRIPRDEVVTLRSPEGGALGRAILVIATTGDGRVDDVVSHWVLIEGERTLKPRRDFQLRRSPRAPKRAWRARFSCLQMNAASRTGRRVASPK